MRALHWFRNDLRLRDNPALCQSAAADEGLATVFVLDDRLRGPSAASPRRTAYMLACLESLSEALSDKGVPLMVVKGDPVKVLPDLVRRHGFGLVTWNADYTPYATERDDQVRAAIEGAGARAASRRGRVVFDVDQIRTGDDRPYSVYTPYWRQWRSRLDEGENEALRAPRMRGLADVEASALPRGSDGPRPETGPALPATSERAAQRRLDAFLERAVADYKTERDFPAIDGTSRLSPALRFGLLSPRQCVHRALEAAADDPRRQGGVEKWIAEVAWRDFYAAVLAANPGASRRALKPAYRYIQWNDDPGGLEAWKAGMTGYPIVDAGMRQLTETGWMHNRVRMIVASFLVKDLLIDWRLGERHFFELLFDGDPASNNGGWQWAASTGNDAAPYFRIFNPTSQAERYDPDGDYVRRYVPELAALEGKSVHRPWESPLMAGGYPAPIVDHAERRKLALERYKSALEQDQ